MMCSADDFRLKTCMFVEKLNYDSQQDQKVLKEEAETKRKNVMTEVSNGDSTYSST